MRQEHLSGIFDFWKKKPKPKPEPEPKPKPEREPPRYRASVPPGVNLYDILGVHPGASKDEIRTAYRRLARRYHPDVDPGNPENHQKFSEISNAYDILTDDAQREAYDWAFGIGPEERRRPSAQPLSTYFSTEEIEQEEKEKQEEKQEEEKQEEKKPVPRPRDPWDLLFDQPSREEPPFYTEFQPSPRGARPSGPPPWDVLFPGKVAVKFPEKDVLLAGVSNLPLEAMWKFVRDNRTDPRFYESKSMVLGPVAGIGANPIEADLAELTGTSFDEIAAYIERYGLGKAWRKVMGPLAEQVVLAIEHLMPEDIPGNIYMDWDPSGRMLELLYTEATR